MENMTSRRDFLRGAACAGAAAAAATGARGSASGGRRPLLRIAIMSDIQGYPYPEDAGMRNLERALDVLAPLKPDVVVNDGDINDSGRDEDAVAWYKARCDARLGRLPHVACMGNHEIAFIPRAMAQERTPAACLRDFNAVFGYGPDEWIVRRTIRGFDFISLSLSRVKGYTDGEIGELESALDAAVARDATRPVFVVTHYHPYGTVNNSDNETQGLALRRLLDRYPQAVSISGHSHNPLQDPRSIWQGSFTAVDTSTLCYGCIVNDPPAANQISCLIPYGHESVGFLTAEVYGDCIVFRRFSARDRREIGADDPWTVPWPHRPESPRYGFDVRKAATPAPQFDCDPEPTIWYDFGYVYLMFNAAKKRDAVFGYRVELLEDGAGAKSYFHLSDYYRSEGNRTGRIVFKAPPGALKKGASYRCRIYPAGFFGAEGRPCEWSFRIQPLYALRQDAPNFVQE